MNLEMNRVKYLVQLIHKILDKDYDYDKVLTQGSKRMSPFCCKIVLKLDAECGKTMNI